MTRLNKFHLQPLKKLLKKYRHFFSYEIGHMNFIFRTLVETLNPSRVYRIRRFRWNRVEISSALLSGAKKRIKKYRQRDGGVSVTAEK